MQKCQVYAGRKISFEPEEVTHMKTFDSSGLELYIVILYCSENDCYISTVSCSDTEQDRDGVMASVVIIGRLWL